MTIKMKACYSILSVIIAVLFATGECFQKPDDCDERLVIVGQCVDKMLLLLDPDATSFEKKEDFVENYCEPFPVWSKCFMQYKTCLKPFQASLFSLINYNVKQIYKSFCKNDTKIQEAFDHLRCLLPEGKEVVSRYKDKILSVIDYVSNSVGFDQLIERGCCSIAFTIKDFEETFDSFCKDKTGLESGKFMVTIATATFSDVWNMICSRQPSAEVCDGKYPQISQEIRRILANPDPAQPNMMFYIIKFLSKLDDTDMAPTYR